MNVSRQPAGSSTGGQFAAGVRAESDVDLGPDPHLTPPQQAVLVDRVTAEAAAYELNSQGGWAVVERVWVIDDASGDELASGFRTTGFADEAGMSGYLDGEGFAPAADDARAEAPDVDYWTAAQPVDDGHTPKASRTRTVEVFAPDV